MILFVVELQRLLYLYGLVNSRSAGYVPVVAGERQAWLDPRSGNVTGCEPVA